MRIVKRVYSTTSPQEALFLQMILRNQGIESVLDGWNSSTGIPDPAIPLTLHVADTDVESAVEAIRDALAVRRAQGESDATGNSP